MRDHRLPTVRPPAGWLARVAALAVVLLGASAAEAGAATLWVAAGHPNCSDGRAAAAVTELAPWCTPAPAASRAKPGDEVRIAAGVYRGTVRPLVSGTASAPIRYVAADPGVTLDAAGAANAVKLINVAHLHFEGMTVTGGVNQGVWVEGTRTIRLARLTVSGNPGAGVQLKTSQGVELTDSSIAANGGAGIFELAGTAGARYTRLEITGNGRGGSAYNGDGIQLGGTGAVVADSRISGNGEGPYEHGVYTAAVATGWTVERTTLADNAGANIKAMGTGTVRYNRLGGGRQGLVLASNPQPVEVVETVLTGRSQHLVFLTTGARARLWHTTVRQEGRSAASGDASAIFVTEAASLELRNVLACYDNPDGLGVALWVNNPARVGAIASDTNRFCSHDAAGRHVAWAGTRVTGARWQAGAGTDAHSAFTLPPLFDADARPLAPLLVAPFGDPLPVLTDFAGLAWPATGVRDVGAHRVSLTR